MVQNGFESRVKIQQIIDSQLPEFILDESPKTSEFLKQYYISQEYQGGPVDIVENLDQYINLDSLLPEVIVNNSSLTNDISTTSSIIEVTSTKGFPEKYGLIKIDDEIITYTGSTETSFIGCIRGFSGITNYHKDLQYEELVFSESTASAHISGSNVQNLSSLFLQEFYKKIKFSLTPGLEGVDFNENLNVGNFIKEARSLYDTKGTPESFRILFNVLFGETPQVIDLERFLIKPSDARFIRRNVAVIDVISGNANNLTGQTIKKSTDEETSASISEVETITRRGKTYYKINFFVGYDDTYPNITGTFTITPNTRVVENVTIRNNTQSIVTVDSTVGFSESGSFFYDGSEIFYSEKTINQFLGCYINSSEPLSITKTSRLISNETYYGYEDGDLNRKVEFIITGILSDVVIDSDTYFSVEGDEIRPQNIGEVIEKGTSRKQIFANSLIYNTSSRYQINSFGGNTILTKSTIDNTSLTVGDSIEILKRNTETVVPTLDNANILQISGNEITIDQGTGALNSSEKYDLRRKVKKARSSIVPIQFGNDTITSNVQNLYDEKSENLYIASNSLPSYEIQNDVLEYEVVSLEEKLVETENYSVINFGINQIVSFITGDKVFYYTEEETTIEGLEEGIYYVEVLRDFNNPDVDNRRIRLYKSNSTVGSDDFVSFGLLSNGNVLGSHKFILYSQRSKLISPQKLLKKFRINPLVGSIGEYKTVPGPVGILKNGVEIYSYKTNDKIYYGPLEKVDILNGGNGYDVIRPPLLTLSTGNALVQPVVSGSVEKVFVDPQDFDLDVILSIRLTGGNGSGSSFEPILEKYSREIRFDARPISVGGGLDDVNENIVFLTPHNLIDGQPIIYNSNSFDPLGVATFGGSNLDQSKNLINEATYYTKVVNDRTIQIYETLSDYNSGINTVGFNTVGNFGVHKFKTQVKNKLSGISVITGGSGYTNRKLRVKPSGISTHNHTIEFENHGFSNGEIINYSYVVDGISGLSTTTSYQVIRIDSDRFRVCNAGIGGTNPENYERKNYVRFSSTGSGYQIFNYPNIELIVEYTSTGIGSTQVTGQISATPVVRGSIDQIYLYEKGQNYGSFVLNAHQRPSVVVNNGKESQLKPIIKNGAIVDVIILYGGNDYYSTPDIVVSGKGFGAVLRPIISNNKITDIVIINSGVGYDENTSIYAVPAGKNAVFQTNVRSLTLNNSYKYGIQRQEYRDPANEILIETENNLQYAFVGYSTNIEDSGGESFHSDIIGWAYDGNPIYGPYGYSDPDDTKFVKKLEPGYSKIDVENRPPQEIFPDGYFVEDYTFTNSGDLDQYNGRFGKTKDFPEGTYAYFATVELNDDDIFVGKFPYFIGDEYRSTYIQENLTLDQSFDFNNSQLIRNTLPYKVSDDYADNDFIVESNELIQQRTLIESVSSGSISGLKVINSGTDYAVGDQILFDNTDTEGGGILVKVSEITGNQINQIDTITESYQNSVVSWKDGNTIKVFVQPYHNFSQNDVVSISGLSTQISNLNGKYNVKLSNYSTTLAKEISNYSSTGNVVDIYVTSIPDEVIVGSSFKIDNEIFLILNIYRNFGVIRASRTVGGGSHSESSIVYFLANSFTINKSIEYFESDNNLKVYYNPTESIGIGTTAGSGINVNYTIGDTSYNNFIPTQSIFIPNHPFENGQQVIFRRPTGTNPIAVSKEKDSSSFNILDSEFETLYIIDKSKDYIGIVTSAELINTNGLFFRNTSWTSSNDDYRYSIESNYKQVLANIVKVKSTVSVSTYHNLTVGDQINLNVKPNLTVGIGTSSSVKVEFNNFINGLIVNPVQFNSSGINTSANEISISSHEFKTGDKILYEAEFTPEGIQNKDYYVYVVDNNKIKLCDTYNDSFNSPPNVINILSVGSGVQKIGRINPEIKVIKNNNITFDLSDSSLSGYNFKLYYDKDFKKEFVSAENVKSLSVLGIGSVGISTNASLTINYSDNIPNKLYYNLEKSGYISTADFDVSNYSEITFVESSYNRKYNVISIADTTFTISLNQIPEKNNYKSEECDILEYSTNSSTASGGIKKIDLLSGGYGYKSIPKFVGSNSENGSGAYIIAYSDSIGKITQSRIINEGFEYSSDKTLRPTAYVPYNVFISSSNTIDSIDIISGGRNYTSAPNLIIVNSDTGELIDSGLLKAKLTGSSIGLVDIQVEPKGLPDKPITIRSTDNSNGITIDKVEYSPSGIVTCTITTPLAGFTSAPFSVGDRIFIEGIEKDNSFGDGFNSSDHGYKFFTIEKYTSSGPDKIEYDISGVTTNPGVAKTVQESYATVINFNDYPEFEVIQKFSPFIKGEILLSDNGVGFIERDLIVTLSEENSIRVSGSYILSQNEKIRGSRSLNEATVSDVNYTSAIYNVSYFNSQNFGWKDETGKLSEDSQVIPDNDYYQNLSYTVKSNKTWEEIVTPVNNLLHTSGTKNFSDTQFSENAQSGIGSTAIETTVSIVSTFVEENRVDTINNFDLVLDLDVVGNKSNSIKFRNVRLADYVLCKTNRVLKIDDISSEFSSSDDERSTVSNILPLNVSNGYNKFLIQVRNVLNNETQFSELITINNDRDIFTLNKADITTGTIGYGSSSFDSDLLLADIRGYVDESGSFYLRFEPEEPFNPSFEIKILHDEFIENIGITSTQSLNCIDLIGKGNSVLSGVTTSILDLEASNYSAIYSNIHVLNNDGSKMNYVEVYLSHDGSNTYLSEYYFDNQDEEDSRFIGSFGSSLSNGILSLTYTNSESENIIVRSKTVGFGTTSLGENSYRFNVPGQIPGTEQTVVFQSNFNNVSSGSTSVYVLDKDLFSSIKSVVKVGLGETNALHQIMVVYNGSDVYTLQYPFVSAGSTSGIGTFGAQVDSSNITLNFYLDQSVSENVEIISLNECFYKNLDVVNIPPDLNYSVVNQSIKTNTYSGINYPLTNVLEFDCNYENNPIFMKTFNPSLDIDLQTGICTLPNHFFNTGEQLIYTPKSTFVGIGSSPIGIGATENHVGVVTTFLPEVVYAIREDSNSLRIATKKEYAEQGIGVTFTSFGLGNAHELEMYKKNEKSLITINNLAQYPISYSSITHELSNNGGQIGAANTIFALSGISSINPTDLLKINGEYVRVENVGLGTTSVGPITFTGNIPLVEVTRGFVGSSAGIHSDSSVARVYRGSYNISKNKIYFTQPPRGNQLDSIGPDENALQRERATFSGRVFLRQDYTSNQLYDDISDQFTGIGQTFILTSQGINTVGLGTSGGNGIVFINSIFQSPTTLNNSQNNYIIEEDTVSGITSITFTGIKSDVGVYISEYDINMNQLPRGGIIVSLGSSSGLGYAPLVGASVTAVVGAGGSIISVGLSTHDILGSGYSGNVSIAVTESNHVGSPANISATVGAGGTLSFNIIDGGTGYSNPTIDVSSPSYENLPVVGVSRLGLGSTTETGVGLLLNVEVGASSTTGIGSTLFEVSNFKITRNGYGFRRGDVFKPVGLVTDAGLITPISEFELTVLDTFSDSFAAWQFGELDYIDSIKNYQNGVRKRFPLFYNSELLSFEVDENIPDSQLIDLDSVLVIFVNGILQEPGSSYQFSGGTSFTFTVAPNAGDDVAIFFYRGTRGEDSELVDITPTIKPGDTVQIFSNNANINNTITQNERFVYNISGSDRVDTNLYNSQGIDDTNFKPLYWTKQKVDLIINGDIVSKSRDSIESQIYPTANIISDFNIDDTEIFVDDISLFDYENSNQINFDGIVLSNNNVGIATTDFSTQYEALSGISNVQGFDSSIIGISAKSGIGVPLSIEFILSREGGIFPDIQVGYPVYISRTFVGNGVTSIDTSDTDIVSISTSYLNNVYKVHAFDSLTGIMTCNVKSDTSVVGIATTGTLDYPVGRMSWGRLSGFTRSSSPISIAVTGYVSSLGISSEGYNSGLSTYPIIQRRGFGLRNNGSLIKEDLA